LFVVPGGAVLYFLIMLVIDRKAVSGRLVCDIPSGDFPAV
jgi:hypothetical protein